MDILERIALTNGMPNGLRLGNGPELTRRALAHWAEGVVEPAYI